MVRKLILAAVFIGGLIVLLVWIQGGFHDKIPGGRQPVSESAEDSVHAVPVETVEIVEEVTVSGTVDSEEFARVAARAQGHVIELNADAGDNVDKGDVLLEIDNTEMVKRKAQARAELAAAKADLDQAAKDYERFKALYEKESIAKKELDQAEARYEMAEAAKERAEAALEEANILLSYGTVRAPFDGVIGERYVNLGDLVTPGEPLFKIFIPASAQLVAPVGEQYAPVLEVGTPVTVNVPSIGVTQKTKLREVVPQRDEKTRTITVKAPLKSEPGLGPGLYGTLTFKTGSSRVVAVPKDAVINVGQLESVKVVENGKTRIRHVKVGKELSEGRVEILSGLKPGDKIVADGR